MIVQTADIEGRMGVSPFASEWTFCARCQHVYGTDDEGCCPCLLRGDEPFAVRVVPAERAEQELRRTLEDIEYMAVQYSANEYVRAKAELGDALREIARRARYWR